MTNEEALELPVVGFADHWTVRKYLYELLITLWNEKEAFSGKRPFGDSGWDHDLIAALVIGGALPGKLDEFGFVKEYNPAKAEKYVSQLIHYVFFKEKRFD